MTEQNGLERSSATERIRALLDGRGVEWVAIGTDTCWTGADGYPMRAWETTNGTHMRVADLTPEQAIEATLGSDLEAENEKLRRLVRHMYTCLDHYEPGDTISCGQCPYDNETWGCDYERLMAELGIEVDE